MITESNGGTMEDVDVDALLERVEGASADGGGIPMDRAPAPEAPKPEPQAPASPEVEFNWNGKPVKATWDKARQWASQGYDYAQKMAQFKAERDAFENERRGHQDLIKRYGDVDAYVKQNPQWWDHVNAQYQQAQSQVQRAEQAQGADLPADHPLVQKVSQLEKQLSEFSQFKDQVVNDATQKQREQEDSALDQEIKSIRENHANLDWDTKDAEGRSLELRVIKHGVDNNIPTFRAAFRDFMHDELLKRAEERGKEAIAKDRQKQTKLGLLGTSPTPKRGFSEVSDHRSKTYNDIEREIKEELGIA